MGFVIAAYAVIGVGFAGYALHLERRRRALRTPREP